MSKTKYSLRVKSTTMLIIDPQQAFGINSAPVLVPHVTDAINNMVKSAEAWGKRGGNVIVSKHTYSHDEDVGRVKDFLPHIDELMSAATHYATPNDHEKTTQSRWVRLHDEIALLIVPHRKITKTEFNPFIGTNLEPRLRHMGVDTLVICGLTTPICVEGAVRGAHERGFKVVLLSDACASQAMGKESAEQAHQSAIGRMGYVFADALTTAEFLQRFGH